MKFTSRYIFDKNYSIAGCDIFLQGLSATLVSEYSKNNITTNYSLFLNILYLNYIKYLTKVNIIACLSNIYINVYVSPGKNSVIANHKWTNIPFMMDIRNKKEAVKRRENFAVVSTSKL